HPFFVRDLHDLEPAIGAGFFLRDEVAHALHEDLAAAARNRIESGLDELTDDVTCIHAEELGEAVDLARAESVNVNGMVRLNVLEQLEIPLEGDVRVVSPLHEDLHGTQLFRLVDFRADLLERERVAFAMLGPPIERAEAAVGDADVRVVDVPVDDVRDGVVRVLFLAHAIGFEPELQERRVRVEIEQVTHSQVAGRKASDPSGTSPTAASRRKKSVRPARCAYDNR